MAPSAPLASGAGAAVAPGSVVGTTMAFVAGSMKLIKLDWPSITRSAYLASAAAMERSAKLSTTIPPRETCNPKRPGLAGAVATATAMAFPQSPGPAAKRVSPPPIPIARAVAQGAGVVPGAAVSVPSQTRRMI